VTIAAPSQRSRNATPKIYPESDQDGLVHACARATASFNLTPAGHV
jgi:hypothetical protein